MDDYLSILQGLRNIFADLTPEDIEMIFKFILVGALGGCMFILYFIGKIFKTIRLSIKAFIDGYKGK